MPAESHSSLDELRVLELCGGLAGAYCGKLFADYGAEVIKMEPPGGDPLRRQGPFPADRPDREAGAPRNRWSMITCSLIAGSYVGRYADDAADAEGQRGRDSAQGKLPDAAQEGAASREQR